MSRIAPPARRTRPTLDAERLAHGDLDVVDHEPVPDRLEDAVAEAQDEHVLDGLLAQVVVDPVDLRFVEVLREVRFSSRALVQRRGRTASRRSAGRVHPLVARFLPICTTVARSPGGMAR